MTPCSPSKRRADLLMELRPRLLLLLWTPVVAIALLAQEALGQRVYTNTWAVLVPTGPLEADRLARKHGFLNLGPVSDPVPVSLEQPHRPGTQATDAQPAPCRPSDQGHAGAALPGGLGQFVCMMPGQVPEALSAQLFWQVWV